MSCGAPLYSYSRFRDDEPSDGATGGGSAAGGAAILIIVVVIVLVVAAVCCWCFARKPNGCGSSCGRAGGRAVAGGGAVEVSSHAELQEHSQQKCVAMFYADWCGHCQQTKPAFHEAAKSGSVPFLLVNCEKVLNADQMKKYGVTGYPSILMLGNGGVLGEYSGDRSPSSFVNFALG